MKHLTVALLAMFSGLAARDMPAPSENFPFQGTWSLVAADRILPGGEVTRDYGEKPAGRLIVDARGRYSLQIFKAERLRYANDSKADGSADEFKSSVLGSSTHFGTMSIEPGAGILVFAIEGSSFPNWEGTVQERRFQFDGTELRYQVPPRADGSIPISVWRRLD